MFWGPSEFSSVFTINCNLHAYQSWITSMDCLFPDIWWKKLTLIDLVIGHGRVKYTPLPPFQIISWYGFSRYIIKVIYLGLAYIYIHNKSYVPRNAGTTCNFYKREYFFMAVILSPECTCFEPSMVYYHLLWQYYVISLEAFLHGRPLICCQLVMLQLS